MRKTGTPNLYKTMKEVAKFPLGAPKQYVPPSKRNKLKLVSKKKPYA